MKKNGIVPLEDYYLWSNKTAIKYPWQRQYLNQEFLVYEKKRINEMYDWHAKFRNLKYNSEISDVVFYVVPIELSSAWKASIAALGKISYFGLSAFYNSSQVLIVGLVAGVSKMPDEYRLIRIKSGNKTLLYNKWLNDLEPAILLNDWEYQKSDSLYPDIKQATVITKIIGQNLACDDQTLHSLQMPMFSAPHVEGSIGGIALSSIAYDPDFVQKLLYAFHLMAPPEYRITRPTKMAQRGFKFEKVDGISFHLAERPYVERDILTTLHGGDYNAISKEQDKRNSFNGEYSFFSTIIPGEVNITSAWKELMAKFFQTEVTLPKEIDSSIGDDKDLKRLKSDINEDCWAEIVKFHDIRPSITEETETYKNKVIEKLFEDLDVQLADIYKDERSRTFQIRTMMHSARYNIERITQAFARSQLKVGVENNEIDMARKFVLDNFEGYINHPKLSHLKSIMESNKDNARFSVVQTELINRTEQYSSEIFESIKDTKLFTDIFDLQSLLDWMEKKGYIYMDGKKRYHWLGGKYD